MIYGPRVIHRVIRVRDISVSVFLLLSSVIITVREAYRCASRGMIEAVLPINKVSRRERVRSHICNACRLLERYSHFTIIIIRLLIDHIRRRQSIQCSQVAKSYGVVNSGILL